MRLSSSGHEYPVINFVEAYLRHCQPSFDFESVPQVPTLRSSLQLIGVTCLLIASKYEEIYAPQVSRLPSYVIKRKVDK